MNFATFIDFLNCLFIDEVEAATKHNNRERFARMVFEGTFEGDLNDPMLAESNRRQAMRSVKHLSCLLLLTLFSPQDRKTSQDDGEGGGEGHSQMR